MEMHQHSEHKRVIGKFDILIKLICHFKRKAGMTLEEFRDRYENGHVPLILKLTINQVDYRRNYRIEDAKFDPFGQGADGEPDFDCITEVWFESREALEESLASVSRPEIASVVVADEEQFMDRSATRLMLFEEERTRFA
jgi:hypothetical protein